VTHAAQIAFALLADVADKQKRQRVAELRSLQHGGNGENGGDAGTVVRNAGAIQAASLLANVERSAGGEHGIEVGAYGDVTVSVTGVCAENVAYFVGVRGVEAELLEFFCEPRSAGAFTEGRGGNARQLQLPLRELRFLSAKKGKRRANLRRGA